MSALAKGGKPLSEEECLELLHEVDEANEGFINYAEFREVFGRAPGTLSKGVRALVGAAGALVGLGPLRRI